MSPRYEDDWIDKLQTFALISLGIVFWIVLMLFGIMLISEIVGVIL